MCLSTDDLFRASHRLKLVLLQRVAQIRLTLEVTTFAYCVCHIHHATFAVINTHITYWCVQQ